MKRLKRIVSIILLGFSGCHGSQSGSLDANSVVLTAAIPVVESVKNDAKGDFELTAFAADGKPVILVIFRETEPNCEAIMKSIVNNAAVKSFEGELEVWFEKQTEAPSPKSSPAYLGTFRGTGRYNAKTGDRLN